MKVLSLFDGIGTGRYDSELITEKAKKELNMDFEKLAYESYCLMNIKYSQENEFFID